jgi:putative peptidoglycan lipid II flippase
MSNTPAPQQAIKQQSPEGKASNASFVVSSAILLSRILGLVRAKFFAHYLGNSAAAGAFNAALRIPNFLQNLFGEGILSASFIPVYAQLRAKGDHETARRVAGTVGAIISLTVSILVLFGVLLTPWFVDLVAPGFEGELKLLTIQIVRILFPGAGMLVLSAWCLGILNSHRKFFISYAAPVAWNVAMIATLVIFGHGANRNDLVIALAWGSVVGSALQVAVQLPFVFRYAGSIPFWIERGSIHVAEIFKNFTPVLVSRGVVQLSAYIDGMIASYLGAAAVASIAYAQTLYLLPVSLFGMAVAAAELPEMASGAGDSPEAHAKLRSRLINGRKRIAFFVIPSVVAFLFLGRYLIELLYETGAFGPEDTLYVWLILIGSVIGLLAQTWGRLYSSAFYAIRDTRTPLKIALVRVTLTIVLGLLFAFPLRPFLTAAVSALPGLRLPRFAGAELGMGAVGLTSSAGIAGWIEFLLLKRALEQRIGYALVSAGYLLKIWGAAIFAAVGALVFANIALPNLREWLAMYLSKGTLHAVAILPIVLYGALFILFAMALKLEETQSLLRRFRLRR